MKIAVATDTNSGVLQSDHQDLYLLPMPVIIDGKTYYEGIDMDHAVLYQAMKEHKDISTSQPAPGQVMDLWNRILQDGYDEIVYIPMSSGLSSSCSTAIVLAQEYEGKVVVVNNHRISVTQESSVRSALYMAEQGFTAQQIKEKLEDYSLDASIYITVDSLEYLKKGGRVTAAGAAVASVLNIKPVLTIQGDKLDAFAKAHGFKKAQRQMLEAIRKDRETRFKDLPDEALRVETAGTFESAEEAEQWRLVIQEAFPTIQVSYYSLPCSIACHTGIGAAGTGILVNEARLV